MCRRTHLAGSCMASEALAAVMMSQAQLRHPCCAKPAPTDSIPPGYPCSMFTTLSSVVCFLNPNLPPASHILPAQAMPRPFTKLRELDLAALAAELAADVQG